MIDIPYPVSEDLFLYLLGFAPELFEIMYVLLKVLIEEFL
jgi:hypothetical protein